MSNHINDNDNNNFNIDLITLLVFSILYKRKNLIKPYWHYNFNKFYCCKCYKSYKNILIFPMSAYARLCLKIHSIFISNTVSVCLCGWICLHWPKAPRNNLHPVVWVVIKHNNHFVQIPFRRFCLLKRRQRR